MMATIQASDRFKIGRLSMAQKPALWAAGGHSLLPLSRSAMSSGAGCRMQEDLRPLGVTVVHDSICGIVAPRADDPVAKQRVTQTFPLAEAMAAFETASDRSRAIKAQIAFG
jgi:hypothetical protein